MEEGRVNDTGKIKSESRDKWGWVWNCRIGEERFGVDLIRNEMESLLSTERCKFF